MLDNCKPDSERGLYNKYHIEKMNGQPIDEKADFFVLRLDSDPAALAALVTYMRAIKSTNPILADDLLVKLRWYNRHGYQIEDNTAKIHELRELVWGMDISSPTVPEYVELHEKMQKILKFIDKELLNKEW